MKHCNFFYMGLVKGTFSNLSKGIKSIFFQKHVLLWYSMQNIKKSMVNEGN